MVPITCASPDSSVHSVRCPTADTLFFQVQQLLCHCLQWNSLTDVLLHVRLQNLIGGADSNDPLIRVEDSSAKKTEEGKNVTAGQEEGVARGGILHQTNPTTSLESMGEGR